MNGECPILSDTQRVAEFRGGLQPGLRRPLDVRAAVFRQLRATYPQRTESPQGNPCSNNLSVCYNPSVRSCETLIGSGDGIPPSQRMCRDLPTRTV
jgi:hypothetical protein